MSIIGEIITAAQTVYEQIEKVELNKKQFSFLKEDIHKVVDALEQANAEDKDFTNKFRVHLESLEGWLEDAGELIDKFSEKTFFSKARRFLGAGGYVEKFAGLSERLIRIQGELSLGLTLQSRQDNKATRLAQKEDMEVLQTKVDKMIQDGIEVGEIPAKLGEILKDIEVKLNPPPKPHHAITTRIDSNVENVDVTHAREIGGDKKLDFQNMLPEAYTYLRGERADNHKHAEVQYWQTLNAGISTEKTVDIKAGGKNIKVRQADIITGNLDATSSGQASQVPPVERQRLFKSNGNGQSADTVNESATLSSSPALGSSPQP